MKRFPLRCSAIAPWGASHSAHAHEPHPLPVRFCASAPGSHPRNDTRRPTSLPKRDCTQSRHPLRRYHDTRDHRIRCVGSRKRKGRPLERPAFPHAGSPTRESPSASLITCAGRVLKTLTSARGPSVFLYPGKASFRYPACSRYRSFFRTCLWFTRLGVLSRRSKAASSGPALPRV
jgi:hypothetical protein